MARVLSGPREHCADIEKLEEDYYNSRRIFFDLQSKYISGHAEVSGREKVSFGNDQLILETLISAKAAAGGQAELDGIRADFEMLASGKKKIAELRCLVEERDQAITSIQKQLKPSRAAHLEDEVVKLQQLVKMTKNEVDYYVGQERHLAETRRLYLQMHRVHQDIQTVEGHLTNVFIKQKRMDAAKETKELHMKNNEKEIATLDTKLGEILDKEKLAKQKFEKHLTDVETLLEQIKEEAQSLNETIKNEKEREQLELQKLINPKLYDDEYMYISAGSRETDCFNWAKGDLKSLFELYFNYDSPSILLGLKHDPRGFLSRIESQFIGSDFLPGSLSHILEEKTGHPSTRDRMIQTFQARAPHLVDEEGNVKALDLEIAVQNLADDPVNQEALIASCRVLREKCVEKRVSEKTVKDVLFRFTPAQIGSFFVKLGVEPIHIDLFLQVLKGYSKATNCHVIGASNIAQCLEGWVTTTVQEDIQLCDFFLSGQKRSIYAQTLKEFSQKCDQPEQLTVQEIEHLFWLFAEPRTRRVELRCPIRNIRDNLALLSQLTHGKL